MEKYKNEDGIELSYEGHYNEMHVQLLKEVVREGLKFFDMAEGLGNPPTSHTIKLCKEFFELNFALND